MLENEIKKNTAAIEANTAAILASQGGINAGPTTAAAAQPAQPGVPAAAAYQAPATAAPVTAAPGQAIPGAAPIVTQPGAVAQPMTHQQAQAELGAIVQALGPADARVQTTMLQYGSARLNEIPAENLFSLVQACRALVTA